MILLLVSLFFFCVCTNAYTHTHTHTILHKPTVYSLYEQRKICLFCVEHIVFSSTWSCTFFFSLLLFVSNNTLHDRLDLDVTKIHRTKKKLIYTEQVFQFKHSLFKSRQLKSIHFSFVRKYFQYEIISYFSFFVSTGNAIRLFLCRKSIFLAENF